MSGAPGDAACRDIPGAWCRGFFRAAPQPLMPSIRLCTAGRRARGSDGGTGGVPHLHLISSLSRRVDRVPTLRDWLWKLEGVLEVADASRGMVREPRQCPSVGLLMDQRYGRSVALPFFGRPAPTTSVPARLALRLGVP